MTVQAIATPESYVGNGVTTLFPVNFNFFLPNDLLVTLVDTTSGSPVTSTLVLNGTPGYSVAGGLSAVTGLSGNGSITTSWAPTAYQTIIITPNFALTQQTHYVPNSPFPAASHENALDRLTLIAQQQAAELALALTIPVSSLGVNTQLPAPAPGMVLGWDGTAQNLVNIVSGAGSGAALQALLASPAAGQGDALITTLSDGTGAVPRSQHAKNSDFLSVKDFGAKGDGATDDTAAIQTALNYIAAAQGLTIPGHYITCSQLYFPSGNYHITAGLNCRGFISLVGAEVAGYGSTTIHQMSANTNIFNFYDNVLGGGCSYGIEGLNFEFDSSIPSPNGYALNFPQKNDTDHHIISSNSHYIKNNRFGGWGAQGRAIYMATCNDVEITGNAIDVCAAPAIVLGDQTFSGPSDVRISQNEFFDCLNGIAVYSGQAITIHGNCFSNQYNGTGWQAIYLGSNTGTITQNNIQGVVITGNTFWKQYNCIGFDDSANNVVYANNNHHVCWNTPVRGVTTGTIKRWKFRGNHFQLDSSYSSAQAPFAILGGGSIIDSDFSDTSVDANGLAAVVSLIVDNGTTSVLGSGCQWRNNIIQNNTSWQGANKSLLPGSCRELVLEDYQSASPTTNLTSTPIAAGVFTTTAFNVGDSLTFDLDYEVDANQPSSYYGGNVGRVRVSILKWSGTLKSTITPLGNISDDLSGAGTYSPVVTVSVSGTSVLVTISIVGNYYTSAATIVLRCRASNFKATGNTSGLPAIKSA